MFCLFFEKIEECRLNRLHVARKVDLKTLKFDSSLKLIIYVNLLGTTCTCDNVHRFKRRVEVDLLLVHSFLFNKGLQQ